MDIRSVAYYLRWVFRIETVALAIPALISLCMGEDTFTAFLIPLLISAVLGVVLASPKWKNRNFYAREGFAVTGLTWIFLPLIGCLPFYLSGKIPHFVDALFETVSGFTTTGSTILANPEGLGYGLLFWRSFTHWLGGMGVLVLLLALLPMSGGGYHMQIMKAESPGPSVSKLVPRVRDTAIALYLIYIVMTIGCIVTYLLSGMEFFDAVCIGVGTAGTGGFGIRSDGILGYNTVSQAFISLWMFLFSINFSLYYLIVKGKVKELFKSDELKVYLLINVFCIAFLSVSLYLQGGRSVFMAFHEATFATTSTLSSTGFTLSNYSIFTPSAKTVYFFMMLVGAMSGSTGGGFKVSRVVILAKEARRELHKLIHPNSVKPVIMDGEKIDLSTVHSVTKYLILYLLILFLSVFAISFDGFDMETNTSAVIATLNNIGPGLQVVGTDFSRLSVFSKIVLIFDMIAGRLELLPILMLFYPKTWKKHF